MTKISLNLDEKTIHIHDMIITNQEIFDYFSDSKNHDRSDILNSIIKTGYEGIKRMNNENDMDFIQRKFEKISSEFEKMFDPNISSSFSNKMIELLKKYFSEGGTVENILKNGPFLQFKREINEEIEKLRKEIIKEEAYGNYKQKSPEKGKIFEDEVEQILEEMIGHNLGDQLIRTTNQIGLITNNKSGDFVLKFGNNSQRIVLEIKDCQSLSYNKIIQTLDTAMKNRNANYAIMIAKYKDSLPLKIGWLNEYDNNKLVCAIGNRDSGIIFSQMIPFTVQWAKMRLQKQKNLDFNKIKTIENGIRKINDQLNRFSIIRTKCSNIHKSTEEIDEISHELRESIKSSLNKIQQSLTTVSEGEN